MTITAFNLGQRLRAAHEQRPIPVSASAPALPLAEPVALTLTGQDGTLTLTAATATASSTESGTRVLHALKAIGLDLARSHRTLIVADRATIHALDGLARAHAKDAALADVAAVAGWWATRAEHPGSGAVLILTEALPRRWTLGVHPDQERDLHTWAQWLGLASTGTSLMHDLAAAVTAPPTRQGLLTFDTQDSRSWQWLQGHPDFWWREDGRGQAALGLATRCDAADLFRSLAMDDPLVAAQAAYSGDIVTGTVSSTQPLAVRADRPLARLRAGTLVDTWIGEPWQVATSTLSGRIDAATIDTNGTLFLTIGQVRRPPPIGTRLTIRPRRVSAHMQTYSRRERRVRQSHAGNWLATRECPAPARRDVPLDIAIAAADD